MSTFSSHVHILISCPHSHLIKTPYRRYFLRRTFEDIKKTGCRSLRDLGELHTQEVYLDFKYPEEVSFHDEIVKQAVKSLEKENTMSILNFLEKVQCLSLSL
jgi:hypothetical protein